MEFAALWLVSGLWHVVFCANSALWYNQRFDLLAVSLQAFACKTLNGYIMITCSFSICFVCVAQDDQRRRGVHRGCWCSFHGSLSCRRLGMERDGEREEGRYRGHDHPTSGPCWCDTSLICGYPFSSLWSPQDVHTGIHSHGAGGKRPAAESELQNAAHARGNSSIVIRQADIADGLARQEPNNSLPGTK